MHKSGVLAWKAPLVPPLGFWVYGRRLRGGALLYRASVQDVRQGNPSRKRGCLVVVMQFYPRFLTREKVDEYVRGLAPDKALFTEFKSQERASADHDGAFEAVDYQNRFDLVPAGWSELQRLSDHSKTRDTFLICQCALHQRCHADLLLLATRYFFQADIPAPRIKYPLFEVRLPQMRS